MSVLSQPQFHDEAAAFAYVEGELWANGPVCPHCGGFERISAIQPNPAKRIRLGLKFCGQCRKQFTVRVGTIFEESKLPLHKWLQAIYLLCSSKKGISSKQIERTLECTYKTAWFLTHRIREAMRTGELAPFGGQGGAVEADETYIGRKANPGPHRAGGGHHKMKVLTLIDRDTGRAHSTVLETITIKEVAPILRANIAREAHLMTDESGLYKKVGQEFAAHDAVHHARDEYVRYGTPNITTNTVEGYFSIFKRGMRGVYQHCGEQHLHRYMAEFDFRYSNRVALGIDDVQRAEIALKGVVGKRLTYRRAGERAEA